MFIAPAAFISAELRARSRNPRFAVSSPTGYYTAIVNQTYACVNAYVRNVSGGKNENRAPLFRVNAHVHIARAHFDPSSRAAAMIARHILECKSLRECEGKLRSKFLCLTPQR